MELIGGRLEGLVRSQFPRLYHVQYELLPRACALAPLLSLLVIVLRILTLLQANLRHTCPSISATSSYRTHSLCHVKDLSPDSLFLLSLSIALCVHCETSPGIFAMPSMCSTDRAFATRKTLGVSASTHF
eukprot:2963567-Rhodomonas_salina.4